MKDDERIQGGNRQVIVTEDFVFSFFHKLKLIVVAHMSLSYRQTKTLIFVVFPSSSSTRPPNTILTYSSTFRVVYFYLWKNLSTHNYHSFTSLTSFSLLCVFVFVCVCACVCQGSGLHMVWGRQILLLWPAGPTWWITTAACDLS